MFASSSLLPSRVKELGDLEQQGTKCHQSSALDAVLSSLCPSHCSLLYQILKLAHQENLLLFLNHRPGCQIESHDTCHCGVKPQDNVTPNALPFSECKVHNSSPNCPSTDCNHHHGSTMQHLRDCKPVCSTHQYPITNCKSEAPQDSSCCCLQRPGKETCTVLCPKRLHYISCHSVSVGHTSNIVCSFALSSESTSLYTTCSSLCPSSSICCNQHNLHSCPSHLNHASVGQVKERGIRDGYPPCPVLRREKSPSPPPLSPIPSDIDKKTEEKPPFLLHHRQEVEADLVSKDGIENASQREMDTDTATEEVQECLTLTSGFAEQNPSGTLLQDVMNRFSEKLETIRPIEKDPPLDTTGFYASDMEPSQSLLTSQNLQFHADAHLTEIITTVLHTGSASDYNLSELFNRHESKVPKSPNTRSRSRQEALAAMTTSANDASTRRHTLKIKRELAMLDQSYARKKVPLSKRAKLKDEKVTLATLNTSSDSNGVKEESLKEMVLGVELEPEEIYRAGEQPLNFLTAERDEEEVKEKTQTAVFTEEVQIIKSEKKESKISNNNEDIAQLGNQIWTPELQSQQDKQSYPLNFVSLQTQARTETATSAKQCGGSSKESGMSSGAGSDGIDKEPPLSQSSDSDSIPGKNKDQHLKETRRSRRNIVPPQRFSSFVTESRKMYFVACFSENIFNKTVQKGKTSTCSTWVASSQEPHAQDTRSETLPCSSPEPSSRLAFESPHRKQCEPASHKDSKIFSENQVFTPNLATKEKSSTDHSSVIGTESSDCSAKPLGRLRSTPKRREDLKATTKTPIKASKMNTSVNYSTNVESPPNFQVQYTSPIKLMFVSAVKDKEGVRYSLKSASSRGQLEESFDPCEESSWSGTLQKSNSQSTESAPLQITSVSPPLKSTTSPTRSPPKSASSTPPPKSPLSPLKNTSPLKSASSSPPPKSASSPAKPVPTTPKSPSSPRKSSSPAKSLKSASSSPKISPRRSSEGTPTKRVTGTETQRSPGGLLPLHETTPQKRRPGRPKKLGPQLEQKVKRPIGRPRKQKTVDSVMGANRVTGKFDIPPDIEENAKNLKITVVYGRSRRNKRTVSEGFGQLQTEFRDAWQAVGLKNDLGILMHNSDTSSGSIKTTSTEFPEELNFVSPMKESASQSSSNIKCQKRDDSVPLRKPGRPAKVKISGISVTVTTVSPRQRKIQINKSSRQSPETLIHTKVLLPPAKEPLTINCQSTRKISRTEEDIETKDVSKDKPLNPPVALRHSMRVRKPSIHFLHAVATSTFRSYSHSNALLRRSKQLLLNKASNERRQAEQESSVENSGEKKKVCSQNRQSISQDLNRVAGVSVDSIFTPKETLRWWAASAEEKTMNLELARRIQHISDTWVSDTVENQDKEFALNPNLSPKGNRTSKHSSVVRTLFDCPPNKPRSCSMQQLCSWFMQTTETQSLAIVKKASSRNPYELMHFPRSSHKKSICHSPQAERLRKHIKKFAKTVPKSPLQHQQAQRRLRKRIEAQSTHKFRRQLFSSRFLAGTPDQEAEWRRNGAFDKYLATLCRARTRFLNRRERKRWQKRKRNKKNLTVAPTCSNGHLVTGSQPKREALVRSTKYNLHDCLENSSTTNCVNQTQDPMDVLKEQNICSKAWSPETLKECRVFLRKINSPDNESIEEEWDSCTVTLDDGSPSAYLFAGKKRELVEVVNAVKTERKMSKNKTATGELVGSAPTSVQHHSEMPVRRQKGKYKSPGVVSSQPPPAKMLRQSRMRGLTGPRWCDFVLGKYLASFIE